MAYEDESVVAFHDINPQAPVHILICPRKHIATLNDVSSDESAVLAHMFEIARKLADQLGIAQTCRRQVAAGSGDTRIRCALR